MWMEIFSYLEAIATILQHQLASFCFYSREWKNNQMLKITGYINDLWKYNISSNMWTWIHGSNTANQAGEFKTKIEMDENLLFQGSMELRELEQQLQLLVEDILVYNGLILMEIFGCLVVLKDHAEVLSSSLC